MHRPQRSRTHNRLEGLSLLATFVSLFVGLSIGLEIVRPASLPAGERVQEQVPFEVALAIVTFLNGGVVLALFGVVINALRKAWRQK